MRMISVELSFCEYSLIAISKIGIGGTARRTLNVNSRKSVVMDIHFIQSLLQETLLHFSNKLIVKNNIFKINNNIIIVIPSGTNSKAEEIQVNR